MPKMLWPRLVSLIFYPQDFSTGILKQPISFPDPALAPEAFSAGSLVVWEGVLFHTQPMAPSVWQPCAPVCPFPGNLDRVVEVLVCSA